MTDKQRILIGKFLDRNYQYTDISSQTDIVAHRFIEHDDAYYIAITKSIESVTEDEKIFRRKQAIKASYYGTER